MTCSVSGLSEVTNQKRISDVLAAPSSLKRQLENHLVGWLQQMEKDPPVMQPHWNKQFIIMHMLL